MTETHPNNISVARAPVYGLVAGLHTFEFNPSTTTPGGTTFIQKEEYSGLLAFLMTPSLLGKKIKGQFERFNADLKGRVEGLDGKG